MDLLNIGSLLSITSFWQTLIEAFVSFTGNYGWAIILFTIALKLVMSPLDYFNRRVTKKNTEMQAIIQPEIAELQAKYPNDKNKQSEMQMQIYKKHGYNVVGSCFSMLINLVITMFVFISLFSALNVISKQKMVDQYNSLKLVYTESQFDEASVLKKYDDIKDENSWAWIKNVWRADTNVSEMLSFEEYYKQAGLKLTDEEKALEKTTYEAIEKIIYSNKSNNGWNGFFILIILAGLTTFLSQYIITKSTKKPSNPNAPPDATASTNKIMLIVMPIVMLIFAWTSSSIFALYLIVSSIMTTLITLLANVIGNKSDGNKEKKKKSKIEVVEYSRNYFKG